MPIAVGVVVMMTANRVRRLRRTDGVGRRKTVDQTGFKTRVHFGVRQFRGMRIVGVLVMGRGIKFLSHFCASKPS